MPKKLKKSRKPKSKKAQAKEALLNRLVHPDAAGIDIGAEELVVAVDPQRDPRPVRTFSAFTGALYELRDWLLEVGITTVALESTGNYWISIYQILEDAGLKVFLVNARYAKAVPGRSKTDVCDAQWLQQLHTAGLLSGSFRPAKEIAPLRYLMRHRGQLVEECSRQIQLIQKVMTEMNIKLPQVFSDIDGQSARAIIEAILAGERDPEKLADLRDRRCRSSVKEIKQALEGDYRAEYIFVLGQCYGNWQRLQGDLRELDERVQATMSSIGEEAPEALPPGRPGQHRSHKNTPGFNLYAEAWRFYGVDLSSIDGVSGGALSVLMSELGTGHQIRSAFANANAFCSWLSLCPDNRISGGKILRAKTRQSSNRVAAALRLCGQALTHSKSKLGEFCRRMKARLGKAEGITAVAHKLARIIYSMIGSRKPYDEKEAFKPNPASERRRLKHLKKLASDFGFSLVPNPSPTL
jgi:transposase